MKNIFRIPDHIKDAVHELRTPLIILLLSFAISLFLYFGNFFPGKWDTDLFGNFAPEIAGALLTFLLLESYIGYRDKKLASQRRYIALRSLRGALSSHLSVMFNIFKATSIPPHSEEMKFTDVDTFFDEQFYKTIVHLDFSASAPVLPPMTWGRYLAESFEDFSNRIEKSADKYGFGFLPSDLDLIEQLITSTYSQGFISNSLRGKHSAPLALLLGVKDGGAITFLSDEAEEYFYNEIRKYHTALVELVNVVNSVVFSAARNRILVKEDWSNHVAPEIGSSRILIEGSGGH